MLKVCHARHLIKCSAWKKENSLWSASSRYKAFYATFPSVPRQLIAAICLQWVTMWGTIYVMRQQNTVLGTIMKLSTCSKITYSSADNHIWLPFSSGQLNFKLSWNFIVIHPIRNATNFNSILILSWYIHALYKVCLVSSLNWITQLVHVRWE